MGGRAEPWRNRVGRDYTVSPPFITHLLFTMTQKQFHMLGVSEFGLGKGRVWHKKSGVEYVKLTR